ncbi:MAG: aminotransferase class V-fold PLP-dependent enzyme [Holophagales bacterium]|nr:aminotransferase class V-fold PLP-dependent enzyme [Holophagales bacterium]
MHTPELPSPDAYPLEPSARVPELDLAWVRSRFPALDTDWALFDNAGGSVPLGAVADAVAAYLRRYGVQLGASYPHSVAAGEQVAAGHRAMEAWCGAAPGEVVLGSSTTALLGLLARALRPLWREGEEVIVTDLDHEANRGPWRRLEASGLRVLTWPLRPETAALELCDLEPLLSERTRLVAMTHCSNVVGRIHDIAAVAERVHAAGALLCVDGVAYAPHRRLDVRRFDADFYAWSLYKTFGPHQAALWGRRELLERCRGQYHDFIAEEDVPYKLEPGGPIHELAASLPVLLTYLLELEGHHSAGPAATPGSPVGLDRALGLGLHRTLDRAFDRIAIHEEGLVEPLLDFLHSRPDVRVLGPGAADRECRVATVAFVAEGRRSSEIPPRVDDHRVAIRWGHFYAPRAIEALGLAGQDGIVRASMVHYNTAEEVDRLIRALEQALG